MRVTGTHAVVRTGGGREPEMGVRLYGVLSATHGETVSMGAGPAHADGVPRGAARRIGTPTGLAAVELLRVRDLVAAVAPAPFTGAAPTAAELDATHTIVSTLFAERAILPAPPGTVFRSRATVAAWLELHAAALAEGLRYVEDRVEARVHAQRAAAGVAPGGASRGLPDVLRTLRREAVALLVLRDEVPADEPRAGESRTRTGESDVGAAADVAPTPDVAGEPVSQAAFLVERTQWGAFASAIAREQELRPDLRLTLTGPWPPYDFVRLELGA